MPKKKAKPQQVVLRNKASGKLDPRLAALLSLDPNVTEPSRKLESRLLAKLGKLKVKSGPRRKYISPPLHGLDLSDANTPKADVLIKFRKDPMTVQIPGLRPLAAGRRIATATVPLDLLRTMENHPDVEYIELTRVVRPLLNKSAPIIGADQMWKVPPGLEGTGIVIGIVDSGFDFYHPDFRDPVTDKTRIQWLWDQSVTAGGSAPVEYGYGAEYTRQQIDLDLNPGPPYSVVPHQAEVDAHGTLVAGVAAGNARADARYRGIAPKAELILVHTMPSNQLAFGSLKWVLEAIDYIFRRAGNTPCVVNLSLGDNLGPHDGTSLLEQKIDELLDGSTYRAVVIAAGNAQQAKKHCELSFTQGSHSTLWMQVPSGTRITEAIEIWYPHDALLDLTITLPGGAQAGPYQGGGQVILDVLSDVDIQVSPAAPDQRNGKNVIGLELRPKSNAPLPPGTWVFVLDEVSQTPWPTNALDLYASIDQNTNIIWTNNFSTRTLITPATCRLGITVGSHEKTQYGNVDADSSWGPTRDGRQKPEIIAPGVGIWTTKAGAQPGASAYIKKVGTSVAAPHVAGGIALLFEDNLKANRPALDVAQIKTLLQGKADPSGPPAIDPAAYGWGRLRLA